MNGSRYRKALLAVLLLVFVRDTVADDAWTQFRGPGARGLSDDVRLVDRWSESENVRWSQEIPGRGWSSPIAIGGRIFLTTVTRDEGEPEAAKPGLYFGGDRSKPPAVTHTWQLVCLDLKSGEEVWTTTLHRGQPRTPRHIKNSYASETPVTDGEHVYALFGDLGLFCLSMEGDIVWSKKFPPVRTRNDWGTAASPVLYKDRLYFVNDNEEQSYLAALDKSTGGELWRVDRNEKSNWSTPYVWENNVRTEIVTPGTGKIRSYGLGGELLFELGGCSSITIATPYQVDDLLIVSSGYVLDPRRPLFAIRPGASGDISLGPDETSNEFVAWCQKKAAPYNPSTLVYGELLYVLYDRSTVATFDVRTGEPVHELARVPRGRAFTASPWAVNGKVFFLNEFGTTFVYQAGEGFKLLHQNQLPESEMYMASPAMVGDNLLIRSSGRIYCIGETFETE